MPNRNAWWAGLSAAALVMSAGAVTVAQTRVRLPESALTFQPPPAGAPLAPVPAGPGATLGPPGFDPYATAPNMLSPPPGYAPPPYPSPTAQAFGAPYAAQPPSLYPNGVQWPAIPGFPGTPERVIQRPRVRYTWIWPDDGDDKRRLGINDFDFAVSLAIPNFLWTGTPVLLSPSFSLHLWDGPPGPTADLPSKAYSAFLDSFWRSDPTQAFGAEVFVRLGLFTDFDTMNSRSFQGQAYGLFRVQVSPTMQLKGGVEYINRVDLKLFPAFGLLWTPNEKTRFDIYFPRPKLASYLSTVGNFDLWWFLAAEYGGGSWTIERTFDGSDRVDINDIRVSLGLEWARPEDFKENKRVGFVEVGWVTQRELVYQFNPDDNTSLLDSFMIRAGLFY